MMYRSKHKIILITLVLVFLVLGFGFFAYSYFKSPTKTKIGWETFTDQGQGVAFQYPRQIGTEYIDPFDWPPSIQVVDSQFSCTEAGREIDRAGGTERKVINSTQYCVTKVTEGAAGSTYTQYAYATPKGDEVFILTFSLRFVQCGNYNESQKNECEKEREDFDIDEIIDRIAETIKKI